jgi:pimeloyl-ACP methyl ester carboxylesterase
MTDVLGYRRFGAQGGDWGSRITARLGLAYPERMSGLHLNMMPVGHNAEELSARTPEESRYLEELRAWLKEESGYGWIQGTRPQTLAFALTDSPAGLAAWIVEKFRAWSDCAGDINPREKSAQRQRTHDCCQSFAHQGFRCAPAGISPISCVEMRPENPANTASPIFKILNYIQMMEQEKRKPEGRNLGQETGEWAA